MKTKGNRRRSHRGAVISGSGEPMARVAIVIVVVLAILTVLGLVIPANGQELQTRECGSMEQAAEQPSVYTVCMDTGLQSGSKALGLPIESTITFKVLSDYLGTNGSYFYKGPVTQNDLFVLVTDGPLAGCYVDVWFSAGLDNSNSWGDFDDEADFTLGLLRSIRRFRVDIGGALFFITDPGNDGFSHVFSLYVKVFRETNGPFEPYLKIEGYAPTSGTAPAKGLQVRVGTNWKFSLTKRLGMSGHIGGFWDSGTFDFEEGVLAEGSAGLDWKFRAFTLTLPKMKCSSPLESMSDGRGFDCAAGAVVSF